MSGTIDVILSAPTRVIQVLRRRFANAQEGISAARFYSSDAAASLVHRAIETSR